MLHRRLTVSVTTTQALTNCGGSGRSAVRFEL